MHHFVSTGAGVDTAAAAGWAERNQRSPPLPATLRLQDTHVSRQLLTLRLPNKGESLCLYFIFFMRMQGYFMSVKFMGKHFPLFLNIIFVLFFVSI